MAEAIKQFVIYKDAGKEWRWRLFAANSKIIADSAEGYNRKADCIHGARLVAAIANGADIWNATEEEWEEG